jgi:hypothetical protein
MDGWEQYAAAHAAHDNQSVVAGLLQQFQGLLLGA